MLRARPGWEKCGTWQRVIIREITGRQSENLTWVCAWNVETSWNGKFFVDIDPVPSRTPLALQKSSVEVSNLTVFAWQLLCRCSGACHMILRNCHSYWEIRSTAPCHLWRTWVEAEAANNPVKRQAATLSLDGHRAPSDQWGPAALIPLPYGCFLFLQGTAQIRAVGSPLPVALLSWS